VSAHLTTEGPHTGPPLVCRHIWRIPTPGTQGPGLVFRSRCSVCGEERDFYGNSPAETRSPTRNPRASPFFFRPDPYEPLLNRGSGGLRTLRSYQE